MLFVVSFLVIIVMILAMSIGVMFGRGAIRGTCGGLNKQGDLDTQCKICGGHCGRSETRL